MGRLFRDLLCIVALFFSFSCQFLLASDYAWIVPPDYDGKSYGVFYFAKDIKLENVPDELFLHISADNRYIFYVNGKELSRGPSRGDLQHWNYESVDIGGALQKGNNRLSVCVWNFGEQRPSGQISERTALWIECEDSVFSTRSPWFVLQDNGYSPIVINPGKEVRGGYLSGASEFKDYRKSPSNWQSLSLEDSRWKKAQVLYFKKDNSPWQLQERAIPFLERSMEKIGKIRFSENAGKRFPMTIPPHTNAKIILDHETLTIGHPFLCFEKGKNSKIRITYLEAPFLKDQYDSNGVLIGEGQKKGNRNIIEGKEFVGNYDELISNGESQYYSPLWYRCFRYIQLQIETDSEPLILKSFHHCFTAYPFKECAKFKSSDTDLSKIWEVSWRTARMCAHETYNDCPYYEQLQYIGDTRIQALISLVVSGDNRLMKQAIRQFASSMDRDGMLQAAYPSSGKNIIPPFSLFWIGMVHDFFRYCPEKEFVQEQIQFIKPILEWYIQYIDLSKGLLGKMPGWHFVDWPDEWAWLKTKGLPSGVTEGESAILSLQFAMIAEQAAELFKTFDLTDDANRYLQYANLLKDGVRSSCFDQQKGCYADSPAKQEFSQHVNALAILCGLVDGKEAERIAELILQDDLFIQCTVYYSFYLHRAFAKIGRSDLFLSHLTLWETMLDLNLSTFAERQEPTRSDCHAWSASPMYELLSGVCGIEPSSAGFTTVRIQPNFGNLKEVSASMPHPNGKIQLLYKKRGNKDHIIITLPNNCTGEFITNQKDIISLRPGKNELIINNIQS